ncbi:MAG: hypothetical protein ACREM1_11895 [Longimicrobiales bacterium]
MRWSAILLASSLAACGTASSSIAPGPELPAQVTPTSTGAHVRLNRNERVVGDVVALSPDAAWTAVLDFYRELGIPIEAHDPAGRVIASEAFRAPRRLLDRPLSDYLDCGTSLTGARVNTWSVSAQLMTQVESTGEGTAVRSRLTATARPRDGSSTPPVPCSSLGVLEREVVRRVSESGGGA